MHARVKLDGMEHCNLCKLLHQQSKAQSFDCRLHCITNGGILSIATRPEILFQCSPVLIFKCSLVTSLVPQPTSDQNKTQSEFLVENHSLMCYNSQDLALVRN